MPAIDFPTSPSLNDEYTFEGRTWLWNGTGWEVKAFVAPVGATGPSGPTGATGPAGATGATGASPAVNGSNTQVLFNDSGAIGGDADLTYDKTANKLTIGGDIAMTGTGAIDVASGTTAERPSPASNGMVRYNATLGCLESYVQSAWQVVANTSLDYGLVTSASTTTFDYGGLA